MLKEGEDLLGLNQLVSLIHVFLPEMMEVRGNQLHIIQHKILHGNNFKEEIETASIMHSDFNCLITTGVNLINPNFNIKNLQ